MEVGALGPSALRDRFRLDEAEDARASPETRPEALLHAIIDIGSNSVRLVVYRGLTRTPAQMFNEKVMAGLGRGVAKDGQLDEESVECAMAALRRFALVARAMGVSSINAVATAAVREARNGSAFIEHVARETGIRVAAISGEAEARGAAMGVIAGIPEADGVVGDLGGGSLELIRVGGGEAHERASLPLGSLKLDAARARSNRALHKLIETELGRVDWAALGRAKPFYAVGGSWRALAHLHMHLAQHPLPIVHQYAMDAAAPARLVRTLAAIAPKTLKAVPNLSSSRIPSLPGAAALLTAVVERLGASHIVTSAYGLREGLVFAGLPSGVRRQDPLLAAAREEAQRSARFPATGETLIGWTAPLFAPEPAAQSRLRAAACLLSDVGWSTNPDFRAERALDVALHGPWVAITAHGRALLGSALFACFGGSADDPALAPLLRLAPAESLARARAWGLALRLGQRLAGGTAEALQRSRLERRDDGAHLVLPPDLKPLLGPAIARRLKALSDAL